MRKCRLFGHFHATGLLLARGRGGLCPVCVLQPQGNHGIGHLAEARNVRTHHKVAGVAEFSGCGSGIVVDFVHDVAQLVIHPFKRPALHAGVLSHLELAYRHTASIGGLGRAVGDARGNDGMYRVER